MGTVGKMKRNGEIWLYLLDFKYGRAIIRVRYLISP